MALDGVWGFVFAGENGIGIGGLVIKDGKLHGTDSGGVKYRGEVTEDPNTGEVTLRYDAEIPAGAFYVGGGSPLDVASQRSHSFKLPPRFGELKAVSLPILGGVTAIFKQLPEELAHFADGLEVRPTQ